MFSICCGLVVVDLIFILWVAREQLHDGYSANATYQDPDKMSDNLQAAFSNLFSCLK